jgi:anthranilate/para-aminobenzoate synthase component I
VIVCDTLVRFDHGAGVAEVLAGDAEEIAGAPRVGHRLAPRAAGHSRPDPASPDRDRYIEMVESVKEHIVAGDVFQCVPSQRAERPTSATPLDIYRALRRVNPSPYLFLLELDGIALVGSSPSGSSPARTAVPASARSPARPSRPRATSSGSSRPRRTAPST